jgi:hypothetical protein
VIYRVVRGREDEAEKEQEVQNGGRDENDEVGEETLRDEV